MLTQQHKHAARAVARIFNKVSEDAQRVAAADRGFDGGERSAGFHAVTIEIRYDEIVSYVAERFGLSEDKLFYAIQEIDAEQQWMYQRSMGAFACKV